MNNFISDVVTDLGSLIDQNFGTLELGTWDLGPTVRLADFGKLYGLYRID